MKYVITALVSMVTIVALTIGGMMLSAPAPATAAPAATLVDCQLVVGQTTRVVCTAAGVVVLNTVVDLPTVTLPPVTVTAPGATVTAPPVTLPPPPRATATETIKVDVPVPGPTSTVTVKVPTDGTTATVTLPPLPAKAGKTVTETVRPDGKPVPTATETATIVKEVTRQPQDESATIDPNSNTDDDFLRFDLDLGDESVSAGEAGVGILGALLIIALILAGMYYGFRRGMAVVNREEAYFLRDMLQK